MFLEKVALENKCLQGIILSSRIAHLASKSRSARDVKQYENNSISQVYHPPIAPHFHLPLQSLSLSKKDADKLG